MLKISICYVIIYTPIKSIVNNIFAFFLVFCVILKQYYMPFKPCYNRKPGDLDLNLQVQIGLETSNIFGFNIFKFNHLEFYIET